MDGDRQFRHLLQRIRSGEGLDASDLRRLYRILSKLSHPYISGQDGQLFIRVQDAFSHLNARRAARSRNLHQAADRAFTGDSRIPGLSQLTAHGYPADMPPREAFFALSGRYFQKGIYRKKVYSNPGLHASNYETIQGMEYWSRPWAPEFIRIFREFRRTMGMLQPLCSETQKYIRAQHSMFRGILSCCWYHEGKNNAQVHIAREYLGQAIMFFESVENPLLPSAAMVELAGFYLAQCGSESLEYARYQTHWGPLKIL